MHASAKPNMSESAPPSRVRRRCTNSPSSGRCSSEKKSKRKSVWRTMARARRERRERATRSKARSAAAPQKASVTMLNVWYLARARGARDAVVGERVERLLRLGRVERRRSSAHAPRAGVLRREAGARVDAVGGLCAARRRARTSPRGTTRTWSRPSPRRTAPARTARTRRARRRALQSPARTARTRGDFFWASRPRRTAAARTRRARACPRAPSRSRRTGRTRRRRPRPRRAERCWRHRGGTPRRRAAPRGRCRGPASRLALALGRRGGGVARAGADLLP